MSLLNTTLRFSSLFALSVIVPLSPVDAQTSHDPVLCREGFVQVVSPDAVDVAQARAAAKKMLAAWQFDLTVMRWARPTDMEGLVTLRLISDDRMKQESPWARAVARGSTFTMGVGLLNDPSVDLTLAHELGHIQAHRAIGDPKLFVPQYFREGHGLMMNQLYADYLHVDRHKGGGGQVHGIMSLTAEEAQTILTDETYYKVSDPKEHTKKNNKMEYMGLYFIEYLRVRKNIPDAVPRIGRVFELVGRGKTYEQAFAHTYGGSLSKTVSEIVAYFRRTETHPEERILGTRFEEYLQPL